MTANLPAPPNLTTLQMSSELWALLTSSAQTIEEIKASPALREACESSHRQLEIICEPCGGSDVERALAPLVIVFGLGDQAKTPIFWKVYRDALDDLPRIALERAVSEYQRTGKFFPKPAEIRELAEPHALAFKQAAYRARKACEPDPEPMPERERIPPEQFKALMADFVAKMEEKDIFARTRNRQVRPPCARVDETGISQEMRAKLAEQRAGL